MRCGKRHLFVMSCHIKNQCASRRAMNAAEKSKRSSASKTRSLDILISSSRYRKHSIRKQLRKSRTIKETNSRHIACARTNGTTDVEREKEPHSRRPNDDPMLSMKTTCFRLHRPDYHENGDRSYLEKQHGRGQIGSAELRFG